MHADALSIPQMRQALRQTASEELKLRRHAL